MPQPQRNDRRSLDDYVGVHARVEKFRDEHPTARLITSIVEGRDCLTVRAEVWLEDNETTLPNATGHASEEGGMGNRGSSAVEKVETAAVGRCLAFLGYEVKEGIASREEVVKAEAPLRAVEPGRRPPPPPPGPEKLSPSSPADERLTPERRELLERVTARCIELGYDTRKQLLARAKAAKMTDAELQTVGIPSLDKLIAERRAEESRLRTAVYAEFARQGLSEEQITGYLARNNAGRTLEETPLEELRMVADGLEVK